MDMKEDLEAAIAATGTGYAFGETNLRERLAQIARIFACDCAERWVGPEQETLRVVVATARRFANGEASWEELRKVRATAYGEYQYAYRDYLQKPRIGGALGCCDHVCDDLYSSGWGKSVLDMVTSVANSALEAASQEDKKSDEWDWQDNHFTKLIADFWAFKESISIQAKEMDFVATEEADGVSLFWVVADMYFCSTQEDAEIVALLRDNSGEFDYRFGSDYSSEPSKVVQRNATDGEKSELVSTEIGLDEEELQEADDIAKTARYSKYHGNIVKFSFIPGE